MNVSLISFYVDYLNGSEYKAWDTKLVSVSSSYTWQVLDYKFTTANNYRISVLINGIEIAKEYITIKMNGTSTSTGTSSSSSTTLYYAGSSVTPGTEVDLTSGYVYGMNGPFYLNSSYTSRVYFKVSNGLSKLSTTKLIADVYKMNTAGTYDFYTTLNYTISDLNWVSFYYDFYAAGSYRVSVYNASNTWINDAYVTINSNASGNNTTSSGTTSAYYSGSTVTAGTSIDLTSGYVYGLGGPFKRNYSSNYKASVSFKVDNGVKSINTGKLIVDIYKLNRSGSYDFYKTTNYNLANSNLTWVIFNHDFTEAGSYKVSVYNSSNTWINTCYMSVVD